MRIAYLILAHDNPIHVARLVNAISDDNAHIFLHIDKKSKKDLFPSATDHISIIDGRVDVQWASFSMVQATLKLAQKAIALGQFDYYVLLSGSSYPLRSNEYILNFFEKYKGCEFIQLLEMPQEHKPLLRIEYFYSKDSIKGLFFPYLNKLMQVFNIKRSFPVKYACFKPYAGSQWWALSDSCLKYVLKFVQENPGLVNFLKETWVPDELFFQMIIGNSGFKKQVRPSLMYAKWLLNRKKPEFFNEEHLQTLEKMIESRKDNEQILFARKFQDNSVDLIDQVKKNWL